MDALPFTVGDDASGKINTGNSALIHIDDLLIFGKVFDRADVERLAAYYGMPAVLDSPKNGTPETSFRGA